MIEALCFGWIDGVRRRVDEDRYTIRFTPRKTSSIWSAVNLGTMQRLIEDGLVAPAGLRAFERRAAERTGIYAYEQRHAAALDASEQREFRRHRGAWKYFQSRPAGYRQIATWWVVSAKRPDTRARRFAQLIECSGREEPIPSQARARRGKT